MKRKMITILTAIAVIISLESGSLSKVMAADEDLGKIVDGSVLTEDEESEAPVDEDTIYYIDDEDNDDFGIMPYGTYLLDGTAKIKNAGSGKITATGATNAKKSCKLKVTVVVERYSKSTGNWSFITSWTATKSSGTYLSTSKTMSVSKGYYYRVRGAHSAGGEAGYSTTNGIWIN